MAGTATALTDVFKELDSYQVEDAHLFFGRAGVASVLAHMIFARPLTVLHAVSGAGKTSLLNAAVQPMLEQRGWTVVRTTPGSDHPLLALYTAILGTVLPSPNAERATIEALCKVWPDALTLSWKGLLDRWRSVDRLSLDRKTILQPLPDEQVQVAGVPAHAPAYERLIKLGQHRSGLSRVLRAADDPDVLGWYVDHLNRIRGLGPAGDPAFTPDDTLGAVDALLDSRVYRDAYAELVARVYTPRQGLLWLLFGLTEAYATSRHPLKLVLVLDQFEELFTQYVDPPKAFAADNSEGRWTLKRSFMEELQRSYGTLFGEQPIEIDLPLHLRFVVSLRDDYIGYLEPLREYVPDFRTVFYRMGHLSVDEASEAIKQPLGLKDITIEADARRELLSALTQEAAYVQAALLQIVCRALEKRVGDGRVVTTQMLRAVDGSVRSGVRDIVRDFVNDRVGELDPTERAELLDILDYLIFSRTVRNIVAVDVVVDAPYRDANARRALLERLEKQRLVRKEHREGRYTVQLTHEFMLDRLFEWLDESRGARDLWIKNALSRLFRLERGWQELANKDGGESKSTELTGEAFLPDQLLVPEAVSIDEAEKALQLSPWAIEAVFRSLLCGPKDRERLVRWASYLAQANPDLTWLTAPPEGGRQDEMHRRLALVSAHEAVRIAESNALPDLRGAVVDRFLERLVLVADQATCRTVVRSLKERGCL